MHGGLICRTLPNRANLEHLKTGEGLVAALPERLLRRDLAIWPPSPSAANRPADEIVALSLPSARRPILCRTRIRFSLVAWTHKLSGGAIARARKLVSSSPTVSRAAYGGDVAGSFNLARPRVAADLLRDAPISWRTTFTRLVPPGMKTRCAGRFWRPGMGQPGRRAAQASASRRGDAFQADGSARVPRAAAPKRCHPPRGRRRSEPDDRQPVSSSLPGRAGRDRARLSAL